MASPNRIYLWNYEGKISRCHYRMAQSAINSVVKRFRSPEYFGIPMYINEAAILGYVAEKNKYVKTEMCKNGAKTGVMNDKQDIALIGELKKILGVH